MHTISLLLLTILCLALTARAGETFYNDGGIDGNDLWANITGPNFGIQDISNGFISAASGRQPRHPRVR